MNREAAQVAAPLVRSRRGARAEPEAMTRSARRVAFLAAVCLSVAALRADAADEEPTTFWKGLQEKGIYERIWERLTLYENEENSVVQDVAVIGRYHGQSWSVSAGQGSAAGWENRRIYLGAQALLFHHWTLHAQMKASGDLDPVFDGLYQGFVKWDPNDAWSLSAGRMDFTYFGLERSVSSTKIATFERGLVANQVLPREVVGLMAEGRSGGFSYRAGLLSGNIERAFTDFSGGVGVAAGVSRDLPLLYETGSLHLDYLFNDGDPANNALEPYDHQLSLWHQGQSGALGVGAELAWAHGLEGHPAVFGVTVLPTYVLAKRVLRKGDALQAVMRLQYAASDGDHGLQLQERYEQEVVPDGFGDRYLAVYGGLNYLVFGDRLKLMAGLEHSDLRDAAHAGGEFAGWTALFGVRVFF